MSARGFTLVELLIATLLLAIATAGGLTALARCGSAWRAAAAEARLHEAAQYVFATLEPELQMAGYFGFVPPPRLDPSAVPASALACGAGLVADLHVPVEAAPRYRLDCAANGGGADQASAVLIVRRVSARTALPEPGRAQWISHPEGHGRLDWTLEAGPPGPDEPGAERRDLLLRAYYVARNADGDAGTPALRVKSLSSIAGAPAFIDTEVMPGVESLQIELLPSPAAPRQVRVTLGVRADVRDARAGQPQRRLTITRHFTLRNAPRA